MTFMYALGQVGIEIFFHIVLLVKIENFRRVIEYKIMIEKFLIIVDLMILTCIKKILSHRMGDESI